MGELDRIRQIGPGPTIVPRVGEGGQRRQKQEERESHRDEVELHVLETPEESVEPTEQNPVEEPYRLDIAV
jgi:hypothetical protein